MVIRVGGRGVLWMSKGGIMRNLAFFTGVIALAAGLAACSSSGGSRGGWRRRHGRRGADGNCPELAQSHPATVTQSRYVAV